MEFTKEQLIEAATQYRLDLSRRVADGDDEEWTRPSRLHIKLMEIAIGSLLADTDEVEELKSIIYHYSSENYRLFEKSQRDDQEIIELERKLSEQSK